MLKKKSKFESYVLYFSTYPPRECGIATFTKDLTTIMDKRFNPSLKSKVLAINDNGSSIYNYDADVIMNIDEADVEGYMDMAEKINKTDKIRLVSIQHEFGIFGGEENGEFLIPFLEKLEKPVVVTFHSILPDPDAQRLRIVRAIAKRSQAITVMAEAGAKILRDVYKIDASKVYVIPHGVPSIEFREDKEPVKKILGLNGRTVLSTFGLINSGKGIEYVIRALSKLVKDFPNILYLVIGETHPNVRKHEGEEYRNKLIEMVKKYGLKNNIKFYNKYLTLDEIVAYLSATDIYVYSALDENQIVSGTLAYALSSGAAIVGTPTLYAREVLDDNRGVLVDFRDSNSMAKGIRKILSDEDFRKKLERNAYAYSRNMTWPNVAGKYLEVFRKIIKINEKIGIYKFPKMKLDHLFNMTDSIGLIQHAKHSISDRSTGYTVDDNSRALIVAVKYYDKHKFNKLKAEKSLRLINTYLSFLYYMQREDGYLHNLISYDKKFLDEIGSEDCYGRSLWACGALINSSVLDNIKNTAKFIFDNAFKNIDKIESTRALAFSLIGMYNYYIAYKDENMYGKIVDVADKLVERYEGCSDNDWNWFEEALTYSNGNIPEALFLAYDVIADEKYLKVAEDSLRFLSSLVILDNKLVLIGHNGWFKKEGKRAFYDQQPIDASSMVQVYMTAYNVTGKEDYYEKAALSYNWFLGRNSLGQTIYDEATGGCYDGLLPDCINLNQGAESTVCYLLARLCF